MILLLGAGIYMFFAQSAPNGLSADLKQQITGFTAYYPSKQSLPAGYALQAESAKFQSDTLLFSVAIPGGGTMHISEQPLPEEFLRTQNFLGKDTVSTPLGPAAISYIGERTSAFLITKDRSTLIIASTNDPVDKDQVRAVLAGLRKQ